MGQTRAIAMVSLAEADTPARLSRKRVLVLPGGKKIDNAPFMEATPRF